MTPQSSRRMVVAMVVTAILGLGFVLCFNMWTAVP